MRRASLGGAGFGVGAPDDRASSAFAAPVNGYNLGMARARCKLPLAVRVEEMSCASLSEPGT